MSTVYFDVDTQIDFLFPAGALYVPGAETILPAIVTLNRHAESREIVVVSTMDSHAENDPEFAEWPAHCVTGTLGQRKPNASILDKTITIPTTATTVAIGGVKQIVFEKQYLDAFMHPNLNDVLQALSADRYVVYGVVTEICVKFVAFGLLRTGKPVYIVKDAVRHLNLDTAGPTLAEFAASGGGLSSIAEELAR